jgi:hypothetical protein
MLTVAVKLSKVSAKAEVLRLDADGKQICTSVRVRLSHDFT